MGTARISGGSLRSGYPVNKNGMALKPRPVPSHVRERVGRAGTRPTFRQTACFDQRAEQK